MLRLISMLMGVAQRHAGLFGIHAKTRAVHVGLLAVFALIAAVYLLVIATVLLAQWLNLVAALAIMAALALVGCLVVTILMRREERQHQMAMAMQRAEERQMVQTALLTAVPVVRRGGIMAGVAGIATLATYLFGRGRGKPRNRRGRRRG